MGETYLVHFSEFVAVVLAQARLVTQSSIQFELSEVGFLTTRLSEHLSWILKLLSNSLDSPK